MSALNQQALQAASEALALPWRVRVLDETPSTNDLLRDEGRLRDVAGQVIFAERQTAGRGRRENFWTASAGQDLILSLAWRPAAAITKWLRVTQMTALAVCRAVEPFLAKPAQIKWPNDVLVDGKKLCGILVESFAGAGGAFLVVGVGLNVNGMSFPAPLAGTATSLRLASAVFPVAEQGINRQELAVGLLSELDRTLKAVEDDEVFAGMLEEVRGRDAWRGRAVRLVQDGVERQGWAAGLTDEGALIFRTAEGSEVVIHSAEQVRLA